MLTHGFCITGTDTDVGKTVITAALLRALRQQGVPARAIKPVQTGVDCAACRTTRCSVGECCAAACADREGCYADAARYADAVADMPAERGPLTLRMFRLAASPHLAAQAEGQVIRLDTLVEDITALQGDNFLLVEGAGGLYVPLNDTACMIDMMAHVGLPLIVVAANRLGVLNHCLLTVAAAHQRGLRVAAIVLTHISASPLAATAALDTHNCVGDAAFAGHAGHADDADEAGHTTAQITGLRIQQDTAPALRVRLPHIPVVEVPHCAAIHHADARVRQQGWDELALALGVVVDVARQQVLDQGTPPDIFSAAPAEVAFAGNGPADLSPFAISPTGAVPTVISPESVRRIDRAHIWHPYTTATNPLPAREVSHTAGQRIYLRDGNALVDGMASWWCAIHGYGHPRLVRALQEQAGRMSHVMFGGLTHQPVVALTERLLTVLPAGLERIFYADSGSVAVEVALKMALQYAHATKAGEDRHLCIVPRGGYHGDTMGAMSVCDPVNGMHSLFTGFLPQQHFVSRPACAFGAYNTAFVKPQVEDMSAIPFDPACMLPLEAAFASHGRHAAACILEPVVQGAGGMWLYHPEYIRRAAALCRQYGVLLIADEIATGFGRTGKMFACEWAGVSPDILCLGKALTGGMMSLAATACSQEVAEGISRGGGVFMHGPTFMANPLACAVAEASMAELLASPWKMRVARIERALIEGLAPCVGATGVAAVRVLGAIGVVECEQPVPVERLQDFFVQQGVWLRPFGRLIYCMPPYTCTEQEIRTITTALCAAVQQGMHCL